MSSAVSSACPSATALAAPSLTLSNGQVKIWNYETQTDIKTFEVTDVPVRCVKYIARKNWVSSSMLLFMCLPRWQR